MSTERDPHRGSSVASAASGQVWSAPLGRLLGRSSRWAIDEVSGLVAVTKDLFAGARTESQAPRPVRSAPPLPALVADLAALVARNSSRSLEGDKHFWGLVRELYTRRPWVPRISHDVIETVGVDVNKPSNSKPEPTPDRTEKGRKN